MHRYYIPYMEKDWFYPGTSNHNCSFLEAFKVAVDFKAKCKNFDVFNWWPYFFKIYKYQRRIHLKFSYMK